MKEYGNASLQHFLLILNASYTTAATTWKHLVQDTN